MEGFIMAAQLLLALTILVGLHEFGHFIFARIFKIRVNKFYIFFDFLFPLPNVLNFALWKKKTKETEYGLGWFPLGGYVDIAGMIDETKDASQLSSVPEPWEFRAKPAWQRMLVMLGGIIVNIVLGVAIFTGIRYYYGEEDYSKSEINKKGIHAYPLAESVGFKTGDKLIAINGTDFEYFAGDFMKALFHENTEISVERNGKKLDIPIPNETINELAKREPFLEPIYLFSVGEVVKGMSAEKSGLRKGDRIVAFNGKAVESFQEFKSEVIKYKSQKITLQIKRNDVALIVTPQVSSEGTIGFQSQFDLQTTKTQYSFGNAFTTGLVQALSVIPQQIQGFLRIFKGHVSASNALSGPIGLSQMFGGSWNWERFWNLTGLLSMALAFMNALPIPALDGGHVIVLLYEMITGRKPSEKFLERTQQIGTYLLLSLTAFVLLNDTLKLLF